MFSNSLTLYLLNGKTKVFSNVFYSTLTRSLWNSKLNKSFVSFKESVANVLLKVTAACSRLCIAGADTTLAADVEVEGPGVRSYLVIAAASLGDTAEEDDVRICTKFNQHFQLVSCFHFFNGGRLA